ncbi:AAA family ATPase [Clostridium frigidicarnis]|uniref:Predicted ATP-dependent endonuclease of the OLD family, contains P-loop ATPase and TOPRIM domains n=1 Tax=Clostridium frigidicarnis TaxID=84698 RepID=A0A1I0YF36_9CLOT|nr:ATP-binding protein [Clostridium frigidicarnis]SFB11376.1 Predicted ATP-dependent endonuclease of the OLD family, contains P-loop ATPase and TOPRIM domains [Clostridium frigidicarnis]
MKIKSLYIENLKALKDFKMDFNDNINILIGENGLGKTTILETIYDMITGNNEIMNNNESGEFTVKVLFTDEELNSIERLSGEKYNKNEELILNKIGFNKNICFVNCGSSRNAAKKENWFNKIVYLPTGVNFKKYKVETPKKIEQDVNIGSVLNSDEMSLNLKEYLVNIHYKDLEDMSIGEKPHRIERFRKLYNAFFEEKEFMGVKEFEPLFKIKATGEMHSADELSAGEKQIFFRGGSMLQMDLNNSIILIDEPELSLHPEWQQKILDFYKEIGKNNQIIIATHSPHIVSSCKKEEVIVLGRYNGKTVVKSDVEETYGWTVEQLLLSVFELKSVRNPEVQQKLDRFKMLYINKEKLIDSELNEFNELKKELEKYLDPEDPSLSLINIKEDSKKLESLLQRLKLNKK